MRFEQLVETSRRVSNTRKRLEKIAVVAALLKQLRGEEIEIAAAYLSGRARQGKIGVGYGVLHDADTEPAERPELEISDVDRALARISEVQGAGSERRRVDLLRELFARCTAPEQE